MTLEQMFLNIRAFLMEPHEFVLSFNIGTLLLGAAVLSVLVNCTVRYMTMGSKRQLRGKANLRLYRNPQTAEGPYKSQATAGWYPSGWYWSDEKQLWLPPRYMEKKENIQA